jgi:hypothetical protein
VSARTASRLAWAEFALIAALYVASVAAIGLILARGSTVSGGAVEAVMLLTAMMSFPVVGVMIASRLPGNAIGWILLGIGLVWELSGVAGTYITWGLVVDPGSVPGVGVVAALSGPVWVPGVGLIGTYLLLLFPDGRVPTPRWRPLAWLAGLVMGLMTVPYPFAPGSLEELTGDPAFRGVDNPLGVEALRPFFEGPFYALLLLLVLCVLACACGLIVRFRRSRGQKRLQLKWLATAAGTMGALFAASILAAFVTGQAQSSSSSSHPAWLSVLDRIALFSFVLVPAAAGVAILRHRLYDIDVFINRALVYGSLTAVLAVVYAVGVVGVGAVLQGLGGDESNSVAVAASTLAVAGLFRPARTRVQAFIDRRFYRRRYDAIRTVEEFASRLRDEVTLDSVTSDLLVAVSETVQPAHASLWLRGGEIPGPASRPS